jgi:hypothetical protein
MPVHKLFSGEDISEEDFHLILENLNKTVFDLIVLQYKLSIVGKPLGNGFSSKKLYDDLKNLMSCEFKDIGLYINTPFVEVFRWRINHSK